MNELPLQLLDDAAFAKLRSLLVEHRFTDRGVCAHTGAETIFDFQMRKHARSGDTAVERPLDVLVRLFMDSEALPVAVVDALLGGSARAVLEAFGLLQVTSYDASMCAATVLLYPTPGPWIVSDRTVRVQAPGAKIEHAIPDDAVYPAITSSSRVFLSTLPTYPVTDYLELCSGSGIAALMGAAAGAERVWAVDITARSTAFATFNARLNGHANVTALEGNLWEPLAGQQFNTIVAHPPYVPSVTPEYIYRDGGEDGEQITRAILAGLADHLAPGGVFHCTCTISSRRNASAAQRARAMLGAQADEFDLVFLRNGLTNVTEHFGRQIMSRDDARAARATAQLRRLGELGVESVVPCTIVVRRHGADRSGFIVEVERSGATTWGHIAWALSVGTEVRQAECFATRILDARAKLSPSARLDLEYRLGRPGEDPWVPVKGRLTVESPFIAGVDVSLGDAGMLVQFTGARTVREHLAAMQADGVLPADVDPLEFAASFSQLVLDGIVETDAFPLP